MYFDIQKEAFLQSRFYFRPLLGACHQGFALGGGGATNLVSSLSTHLPNISSVRQVLIVDK